MKRVYRPFLMLFFFICCSFFTSSQGATDTVYGAWELVMDKNGIKAYARKIEGSGIFEFRAVTVADAPPEVVSEMLRDVGAVSEWLPYCNESRLLKMEDRNNFTTYFAMDLPWPVKDRDLVMQSVTEYDLDHARAVTDLYDTELAACPPKNSHIRMPFMKGQYVFEFVTRERTGIIHTYRADIGGSIPEWMANFATKHTIYNEFLNMKEMFQKKKYIELGRTSPDRELIESMLADKEQVKKVLVARLREFIGDSDFVDMLGKDRNIDDLLRADNGRISETLLYGWGSDASKKKAIGVVLKLYLAGVTRDEQLTGTILGDDILVNTILRGPAPGQKTSRQLIEAHLKTGCDTANR